MRNGRCKRGDHPVSDHVKVSLASDARCKLPRPAARRHRVLYTPEERELIDWATLADAYERSVAIAEGNETGHSNENVLAAAE